MENSSFASLTEDQSVDMNNISTLGLNLGECSNDLPSILEYYQGEYRKIVMQLVKNLELHRYSAQIIFFN